MSFGSGEAIAAPKELEKYPEYYHEDEKINERIQRYIAKAERNDKIYMWLSFTVTFLTAGSTFVSGLQAARKEPTNQSSRKYLIVCAILTFLSTTLNSFVKEFNDTKNEAIQSAAFLSKD